MTDDVLQQELLRLDVLLRRKPSWETPRAILLIVATTAAIAGASAGFVGFKIGQTPPAPIIIHLEGAK